MNRVSSRRDMCCPWHLEFPFGVNVLSIRSVTSQTLDSPPQALP